MLPGYHVLESTDLRGVCLADTTAAVQWYKAAYDASVEHARYLRHAQACAAITHRCKLSYCARPPGS